MTGHTRRAFAEAYGAMIQAGWESPPDDPPETPDLPAETLDDDEDEVRLYRRWVGTMLHHRDRLKSLLANPDNFDFNKWQGSVELRREAKAFMELMKLKVADET